MKTREEILQMVENEDVEFIRLQFTDMFGTLKNVAVTATQLQYMKDNRYLIDGSCMYGELRNGEEDMYLCPDLDTFVILPWRPQQGKVARLLCDVCRADGTPLAVSPREILKKTMEKVEKEGYTFQIDPECEFFLFHEDENGVPTTVTHEKAGYMDISPLDLGENARRDMVMTLEDMGFEIESSHHEKAPGQHEIDFRYAGAMETADRIVTFKTAVRSIAKRFGLYATFMPKPKAGTAGSGMHINISRVEDIERVQSDIAREGQMLVYAHYNIILAGLDDISKAINYVETSLFDCGIIINKQCFNQLELFECALPGNAINLNSYDKFLTTSDAAICLLFKEKLQVTENSPFLTYFTDRQGLPVGIDMSGKEGEKKYTNNSNFFVLGPSGSGKSFYVNSKVRQWVLDNTDIVLVDTGHSYSGMCEYYHGKYITYSESKPISMNPFRITEEEYNVEKKNFLKSLIFLIWKGANGEVKKQEEEIMDITIEKYYSFYFHPFNGYSDAEKEAIRENLLLEFQVNEEEFENEREKEERKILSEKIEKLQQLVEKGEGGEKTNAEKAIQNILIEKGFTRQELDNPETRLLSIIERRIQKKEDILKEIKVESLSFNSFYEFSLRIIPIICKENKIDFDITNYKFLLKKFYKGGQLEKTLNEDFDTSLFEEPFIVFEIDAIKDDPELFPIVTLIIMDVFIQKMRLKKNRKALIIEEAWKAIASPMMAGYILYLYKTVRKFWGMAMVVTQELEDIISNPVVKNSIISNSDIICLLDQSKFIDKYQEIANLLSLTEVNQKQIFTINQLPNKENRNRFNEVFIKRGNYGNVFGVEVSLHEYFTFTTERIEKDAVGYYHIIYGSFQTGLDNFIIDLKSSKLKNMDWVLQVNKVLGYHSDDGSLKDILNIIGEQPLYKYILDKYKWITNR